VSHNLPVDVVWLLLSTLRVFTDLSATLLMRHDRVALYAEESQVEALRSIPSLGRSAPLPATPLAWDGRLWMLEALGEVVQLRPEIGEPLSLPRAEFEHLQQEGSLWVVDAASPSPIMPEVRQMLEHARPRAQQEANRRLAQMLAYARGEPIAIPRRSVQRWWRAYRSAEGQHGCGYLGLLDRRHLEISLPVSGLQRSRLSRLRCAQDDRRSLQMSVKPLVN